MVNKTTHDKVEIHPTIAALHPVVLGPVDLRTEVASPRVDRGLAMDNARIEVRNKLPQRRLPVRQEAETESQLH